MSSNLLKKIEREYPVESITYKGEKIWSLFRLQVNESLRNKEGVTLRTFRFSWRLFFKSLNSLFYGLNHLFLLSNYKVWAFSSSDRRKIMNSKYVDRVLGGIVDQYSDTLIFENPYPLNRHFSKKETDSKKIISQAILWGATKFLSLFLNNKLKIENEDLLIAILKKYQVQIDYKKILINYIAQYKLFSVILGITQPKVVFFVYSASSMGYIKALKRKKIPVVELQHGVINKAHYAYNVHKDLGKELFPDYLFCYGDYELEVFGSHNFFISRDMVFPIGYYYLDEVSKTSNYESYRGLLRKTYTTIVTYSFQEPFESYIFDFLIQVAKLNPLVCYLLVPRDTHRNYSSYNIPDNIIVQKKMNIYECIIISDFHSTINSTCAIESLCLGVPNILFNYRDWAITYYKDMLQEDNSKFVKTPQGFIDVINNNDFPSKREIINNSKKYIYGDYKNRLKLVMDNNVFKNN
ncbi:hypothetical protein [Joostella sp.]|uniref:hypothetical protein n=1 Tax=Joostella sp. TaxID=2231138 RepID=UPI003A8DAC0F